MAERPAILCPYNLVDEATSVTCADEKSGYPASNLQRVNLDLFSRSDTASTSDAQWTITWSSSVTFNTVVLADHNGEGSATFSLSGAVSVSNEPMWYGSRVVPGVVPTAAWTQTAGVSGTSLTITVNDTGNADGHIDIGRIFVGMDIGHAATIDFGPGHSVEDSRSRDVSEGGQEFYGPGVTRRLQSAQYSWVTEEEAFTGHMEMQLRQGRKGDVFFWQRPDGNYKNHKMMLARIAALSEYRLTNKQLYTCGLRLREIK